MHTCTDLDTWACTHTWSWRSLCRYWSAVRWGHSRMTAVRESPLPPHTQQRIKDKQICSHRKTKFNCVLVCMCALDGCPCLPVAELQFEWGDAITVLCLKRVIGAELCCFPIFSHVLFCQHDRCSETTSMKPQVSFVHIWFHRQRVGKFHKIWSKTSSHIQHIMSLNY